jgi:hypothetical protein
MHLIDTRTRRAISGHSRAQADFLSQFNLILPVQSSAQKYFCFHPTQITGVFSSSRLTRGAFRDRHGRGVRDAVDADGALTNALEADGEDVWS